MGLRRETLTCGRLDWRSVFQGVSCIHIRPLGPPSDRALGGALTDSASAAPPWHAKSKGGSREPPMDSAPFHVPCQTCGATARLDRDVSSALVVGPFRYTLCTRTLNNNSRYNNDRIPLERTSECWPTALHRRIPLARASDTGSARQGLRGLPRVGPSPTPGGRPLRGLVGWPGPGGTGSHTRAHWPQP